MKLFLFLALGLAALGVGLETQALVRARAQLAAEKIQLARLETQLRTAREQRDERTTAQHAAEEKRDGLQVVATARETRNAQAIAWRDRVKAFQQRVAEIPDATIPEFKLLGMKDWVEAVLYEDATTDRQIQKVLTSLQTRARARFAALLPDALSRFTAQSGGELPRDVQELLPYLAPPADAEMLAPYSLRRSGKIGERNEDLLVSTLPNDRGTVAVTLGGYRFTAHPDDAAAAQTLDDLSNAIGEESLGQQADLGINNLADRVNSIGPVMEVALPPMDEAFGDRLKAAVKQFSAANGGRPPADVSQLRGYLPDYDQLAAGMRTVAAQLEYAVDHGKVAEGDDQLRRYLEHQTDPTRALRQLKLTVDGEHVSMEFSL
ncbi:MAG TPA: hypothetical protein VHD62_18910 [Opitutaceae bacterium]|nr:hypothetical protein [Opitutaceae bacterium]